jgi:hypothetical protein
VVDRRCDRPIESSIVHLLLIGLVGFVVLVGSKLCLCSLLSYWPVIDSRRHCLPKLEVEILSYSLYAPIYPNLIATLSYHKIQPSYPLL